MKQLLKSLCHKLKKQPKKMETPKSIRAVPPFPSYICMETTNACNLRCVQCLYRGGTTEHYHGKVGFIDIDLAKNILNQLKIYGTSVMLNGDGEALLHSKFHEIAKHAISMELPSVYFNTNGTLMTPEFTDEFISYFKGSVSISLDGFKESHERLRVGSSYDNVIRNIEYLRSSIMKSKADIKLSVAFCNYDQPAGEYKAFVNHWIDKVDYITVGEVYNKDYKIISNRLNQQNDQKRVMCGIPWDTFIVRWDGKIVPCSNCFSLETNKEIELGDARTQSLYEIWHGQNAMKLRKRTESWELQGTICESCERWNMYVNYDPIEENNIEVSRSGVFTTYRRRVNV